MTSMAQKCHASDHEVITKRIEEVASYGVNPQLLSKYLYGYSLPEPEFFRAFAEAFSLTTQERRDLAWLCSYGYTPSEEDWLHSFKES